VKALALGADAVSMGRPYLYALAAAGERGVDQLLGFMREGMERTMALTGVRSVGEIDRGLVRRRNR
jgi:L-lactate dehydrogenase (cytochrome)